ncbi:hypothetical protein GCM10022280_26030 [Sphingomonas swuensis]|uniref:Transglutaminase n=1 Tax=Sphingomonas swuensis TaxID=977800 RepID=A0ABP7TBW3_9SPHN
MDRKALLLAALGAAALLGPAPAVAQSASPYAVSASAVRKSEALLGTGSKLAALLAQQGGTSAPPASAALQPASFAMAASYSRPRLALRRAAITSGRPDVFGSVALPVTSTPLDRRWNAVVSRSATGTSASWAASLRERPEAERIELVNRFVNARISFIDDERLFGRADVWQSASDSLGRGRGDCEDYAIAKLQLLRAAGFEARDLYLVILKDLVRRSDHAVLAVQSEGRLWVLDNGTDRVTDSADIVDYRPIFSYSAGHRWTHGYRRSAEPPLVLASATPAESALPVPAAAPADNASSEPRFTVSEADFPAALLG